MPGQESNHIQRSPSQGRASGSLGTAVRLYVNSRNLRQIPRLLREGPGPLIRLATQIHNTSQISHCLAQGRPVSFVTSFPRSGNNWLRYLLADVVLQSLGLETSTELPVHPDKIVPDIYCNWISVGEEMTSAQGLLVKTHQGFDELKERFGGTSTARGRGGIPGVSPFRHCKFIYLYRSPDDALVSFYHYAARTKQLKAKTANGIDAFCMARLGEWETNMAGYLRAADEGAAVRFVPYELLLQYPSEIFSHILRWLGLKHDNTQVERAVSNMEFSKLQALEAQGLVKEEARPFFSKPFAWFRPGVKSTGRAEPGTATVEEIIQDSSAHLHFRLGGKGAGRAELQAATFAEIQDRTAQLVEQANSRVMTQQSLHGSPASSKTGQIRIAAALQKRNSRRLPSGTKMQLI